jgi:hypothetical protein
MGFPKETPAGFPAGVSKMWQTAIARVKRVGVESKK